MTVPDAQGSLDDIRRMRERTAREYVRQMYGRPYAFGTALGVFMMFASFDLAGPWHHIVLYGGLAVTAVVPAALRRRAAVHRRPSGPEVAWVFATAGAMIMMYVLVQIAAVVATLKLGMPAPHTVAAAVLAVLVVATAGLARRLCTTLVLQSVAAQERRRA